MSAAGRGRLNVKSCARCGLDHQNLVLMELRQPMAPEDAPGVSWTHWAKCPTSGEPIMVRTSPATTGTADGNQRHDVPTPVDQGSPDKVHTGPTMKNDGRCNDLSCCPPDAFFVNAGSIGEAVQQQVDQPVCPTCKQEGLRCWC